MRFGRLNISIYSVYHVLLCLTINYTWSVQWRPRCISCREQCVCGLDNLLPLITCRRMAAGGAISGRHSHTPASCSPRSWVWSRSETVVTCSALSTTRLTPDWYADTWTVTLLFSPLLSQRSTRLREFCPFLCQIQPFFVCFAWFKYALVIIDPIIRYLPQPVLCSVVS